MKYRAEIDGLRALAVVPVVLFHAGVPYLGGGFVGVDVFFVISGYLITSILITELAQDRFTLLGFYDRRARRILPALFCVMLVCLPFAWVWMLPSSFEDFSRSLIAVVLFASNILFWSETGYFGALAAEKPLLHTWSLAVEEQYYLLFPVFLMLCWRVGRRPLFWIMVLGALLSLALSHWASVRMPSANFYLAPFRVWELLAGSLCAFLLTGSSQGPFGRISRLSQGAAAVGVALIVVSLVAYDKTTPFPSLYAVVPVAGTCLIVLFAHHGTWAAQILGQTHLVAIGLISYSTYLWHQPLLAFARLRSLTDPNPWIMAGAVILSFVLAYLTWRFVEQPFRRRPAKGGYSGRQIAWFAVLGGVFFVAVGAYGHLSEGRNGNADLILNSGVAVDPCHWHQSPSQAERSRCDVLAQERPFYVLVGDSHAGALFRILQAQLDSAGYGLIGLTNFSKLPVPGTARVGRAAEAKENAFVQEGYDLAIERAQGVIVSARWALYIEGGAYERPDGFKERPQPDDTRVLGDTSPTRAARAVNLIDHTVAFFTQLAPQTHVILIGQVPEVAVHVPKAAMLDPSALSFPLAYYEQRIERARTLFEPLPVAPDMGRDALSFIDPAQLLCDATEGLCFQAQGSRVLYFDDDHLSDDGAALLAAPILRAIAARSGAE